MNINSKKGAISLRDVPSAIIVLVFVGVILGIGGVILLQFQNQQKTSSSYNIQNETHTNTTYGNLITLANAYNTSGPNYVLTTSSVAIFNQSGLVLTTGNVSMNENGTMNLNIIASNGSVGTGTLNNKINISYSYTRTNLDGFYNATNSGIAGINTISSFQTIIAVVIAAAVILGVIFFFQQEAA